MIRFSAVLVAVAIGVLIGGIAASKLLLVYIAILVSAVALVALASGVVLKREELFGEGQGAPAETGASPVPPAPAGDSDDQNRSNGHVTPSPPQGAAVGPGAAFAAYGRVAFPRPGGTRPGGAWETGPGRGSWSAPVTAASFPAAGQGPAPGPGAAPGIGRSSSDWFSPVNAAAGGDAPSPRVATAWSWLNGDAAVPADKGRDDAGDEGQDDAGRLDDPAPLDDPPAAAEPAAAESAPAEPAATAAPDPGPADPGTAEAAGDQGEDPGADLAAPAGGGQPAALHLVRDPGAAPGDAQAASEPESEPPAQAPLVTVIPGVPRFHQPDCVLVRFMSDDDTQKLPVAQAKEAGCTPCAACHPEG